MFFDKDKVRLRIQMEQDWLLPGQYVNGTLVLEVVKEINVTAVRLCIKGVEKGMTTVKKRGSKQTVIDEFVHYQKLITFFGYSKESGRKGGATLSAGKYEYPFSVQLPPDIAPSFFCKLETGSAQLMYKITALVDIPNGFDAKVERAIVVQPAVPVSQLAAAQEQDQPYTLPPEMGLIPSKGGCSCCPPPSGSVSVAVEVPNRIVVIDSRRTGGGIDSSIPVDAESPIGGGPAVQMPSTTAGGGPGYYSPGQPPLQPPYNAAPSGYPANSYGDPPTCGKTQPEAIGGSFPMPQVPTKNTGDYVYPDEGAASCQPVAVPQGAVAFPPAQAAVSSPTQQQRLPQSIDYGALPVRVKLQVEGGKPKIKTVHVELKQYQQVTVKECTVADVVTVASADFTPPSGSLGIGKPVSLDLRLVLGESLRVFSNSKKTLPLPSITTPMLSTSTMIEISFPRVTLQAPIVFNDIAFLVSTVDYDNVVQQVPPRFSQSHILPEDKLGAD